jgi:hypothetical protein
MAAGRGNILPGPPRDDQRHRLAGVLHGHLAVPKVCVRVPADLENISIGAVQGASKGGDLDQERKFRLKTARGISKQSNFGWGHNPRFGSEAMCPLSCVRRFSFFRRANGRHRVVQNNVFRRLPHQIQEAPNDGGRIATT